MTVYLVRHIPTGKFYRPSKKLRWVSIEQAKKYLKKSDASCAISYMVYRPPRYVDGQYLYLAPKCLEIVEVSK